ncbi:CvpA family protein [Aquisalimonas sp. APHAB1-3]|uniref:CvpA family protein n=1 Tax=unclassified Aquisalimonas TaxID=2644645 RepID=UPI0025C391FE|nr:CvpA family protein [Aquisalimonas sp.]
MNWLDYAILAVIVLSALISLIRGFVREVISLVVWVAAFWISIRYADRLAVYLADYIASPTLQLGVAFVALFVVTLIIGAIINYVAGQFVGRTGLTGTDRYIGVIFGLLRGVVVVGVLVLAAGLTALPREPWWQESVVVHHFQPWVCDIGVREWLDGLTVYAPLTEDPENEGTPAPEYWQEFCNDAGAGDD